MSELNVTTPSTATSWKRYALIVDMTLASERTVWWKTLASFAEDDEITYGETTLSDGQLSVYKLLQSRRANAFYQKESIITAEKSLNYEPTLS